MNDENYLVPIVFGEIFTKRGLENKFGKINKKKTRNPNKIFSEVKILLDSGASSSLVNKNKILGNSQSTEETSWETMDLWLALLKPNLKPLWIFPYLN